MGMKTTKLLCGLFTASLLVLPACKSTDPTTGEKKFDPVKTEQVKAAIEPLVAGGVRRVIANSPQHADDIASYFRNLGTVFCKMRDSGQFSPDYLVAEADKATAPLQAKVDQYAIDLKNGVLSLYRIFYADRLRAELPPDKWTGPLMAPVS